MEFVIVLSLLLLLAFTLERKIITDYNKELKKYNIKIRLEHDIGQPWEVDGE